MRRFILTSQFPRLVSAVAAATLTSTAYLPLAWGQGAEGAGTQPAPRVATPKAPAEPKAESPVAPKSPKAPTSPEVKSAAASPEKAPATTAAAPEKAPAPAQDKAAAGAATKGGVGATGDAKATSVEPKSKPATPAKGKKGKAEPEPDPEEVARNSAREAYTAGEAAYNAGDFVGAQAHFQKAMDTLPGPHAAYWLAKCLDGQNRTADAVAAYRALLESPQISALGEDKLADASARLAALQATLPAHLTLQITPANATLTVDGNPQVPAENGELTLTPGKHTIVLSAEGFLPTTLDVEVQPEARLEHTVALEKTPPPAPPPAPPPPPPAAEPHSKTPAYITLGVAAVSAGVGTYFGIKALNDKDSYDSHPTTKRADITERDALVADMAFGVALTLGITGVVLLTGSGPEEAPTKTGALVVAPYASPKGGGAAAQLTF